MNGAVEPANQSVGAARVAAYLAEVPSPQRETLMALRSTLRTLLPFADEEIKYAMPAFVLDGKGVAAYAAFQHHVGYFPMSGSVLDRVGDLLGAFTRSAGGVRFPIDKRVPVKIVRALIRARLTELSEVQNGKRIEYFDNGRRKTVGSMKNGLQHGKWEWYRKDGSLMQSGSFSNGMKTGVWTMWSVAGNATLTRTHS